MAHRQQCTWLGERGRHTEAGKAMKEVGRRRTGLASLPHVKIAPRSAPSPTRERQEHLDASTAFAEPAQRPHLFQEIAFLATSMR